MLSAEGLEMLFRNVGRTYEGVYNTTLDIRLSDGSLVSGTSFRLDENAIILKRQSATHIVPYESIVEIVTNTDLEEEPDGHICEPGEDEPVVIFEAEDMEDEDI